MLTDGDAGSLANSERPTVLVMMTCLNGYFQDPLLDAVVRAKASVGDQDIRPTWILFGDPTMQVR